ncbi:MAG TPA: DUF4214 domain-containing protein [Pirellulales bacterium]|nr:DUF4214 domain-containing protein [Pirellulales bacterium]
MQIRRSDRSRKARETRQRRSSVFFRPSLFTSEGAAPERRRLLSIEGLEDRRVLAAFSEVGGNLIVNLAANEAVGVAATGADAATLTLTGGTWSGTDDANVSGNGTATLTVAHESAFGLVDVSDSGTATSVAFNDSGANAYATSFTIGLHDSPAIPGLAFNGTSSFGAFDLDANVDSSIAVNSGASLSTTSGNITLQANQGVTPTSGNFVGIDVDHATITSASGAIVLKGKGGDTGSDNDGVLVQGAAQVLSTGAGSLSIAGAAGAGSYGIDLIGGSAAAATGAGQIGLSADSFNLDATSSLKTAGGDITVGADAMTIQNSIDAGSGIVSLLPKTVNTAIDLGGPNAAGTLGLTNAELAQVTAGILRIGTTSGTNSDITFTSPITDVGAGWNTLSLLIDNPVSSTISQNAGASLTVANLKVFAAAVVNLSDSGNAISQISGVASGSITFVDSTSLTVGSVDPGSGFPGLGSLFGGTVQVTVLGAGGLLTVSNPIDMTQFGNSGDVVLSADDMAINAAITAPNHTVTLQQGSTTARDIDLGGGATPGDLGISDAELGQITAGSVLVGRSDNPGNIVVTAAVTAHAGYNDLSLISGGNITVGAGVSLTAGGNVSLSAGGGIGVPTGASVTALSGNLAFSAAGTTSIAGTASASTTPTVTGGSLFVDYTGGASVPQGLAFSTATSGATLTVSDAGGAAAHAYDITSSQIVRDGAAPISYSGTVATVTVDGGSGNDSFDASPSATATINVNGGLPTALPGDALSVDLAGTTNPQQNVTGTGAGQFTFGNFNAITYSGIESTTTTNGSAPLNFNVGNFTAGAAQILAVLDTSGTLLQLDVNGTLEETVALASISSLTIAGNSADDELTVDSSNGDPIPSGGLAFDAQTGHDNSLILVGSVAGRYDNEVYTPSGPHSGTIALTHGAITSTISYAGLRPIEDLSAAANVTYDASAAGTDAIDIGDPGSLSIPTIASYGLPALPPGTHATGVFSHNALFETVYFANKTNVAVQGAGQLDTYNVNITAANAATGLSSLTMNTGTGAGSIVNLLQTPVITDVTGAAANQLNVGNAGSLSGITGPVNLTFTGSISTDLTVDDSADATSRTVGVSNNQLTFSGLVPSPLVTYNPAALDSLLVEGGSGGNTFNVNSTAAGVTNTINAGSGNDQFFIAGGALGAGSTNNFNGQAGNDVFNVTGPLSAPASIDGGGPDISDVLNYDTGGQNVVMTANTITAGAGQTLTFSNIEDVNLTLTDVGGVTVEGDNNPNNLVLTRTGLTTDAYTLDGGPLVTLDGASSFAFFGEGGADHMQINETAFGLPQFGGAAAGAHTDPAFAGSLLTPVNVGIDFSGGGNPGDSLGMSFLTSQNVTYFDDNFAPSHSGVVNVAGQFSLSFDGLAPVNFTGAGGTLTVNTLSDPFNTSLTVADDGTPGDGVSQITGNGGFETTTFSGYNNLVVQGLNATGESITLAGLDSATSLSNVTLQGGAGDDNIAVQSLLPTVAAALLGGTGTNAFDLDNAAHNLQQIAGPVVVSPAVDLGPATDSLFVNDSGDPVSRTVQITAPTIEGITGYAGAPDITYGASSLINSVSIFGGGGGNTFNIQSTHSATIYNVNTGSGDDTINVSSDAPANTGTLSGIQGQVQLDTGAGNDSLNVSDLGGAASRIYSVTKQISGATLVAATGTAGILYDSSGAGQLEHFSLTGTSVGGSTYNINDTTGTLSNVVHDGAGGASGDSTFNIQADHLQAGASNTFNGFDGGDTFNLNFTAGASISSAPGTTLVVDGGGPATDDDRVNVNANLSGDGPRTVQLDYQAGNAVLVGGLGTVSGIQVNGTRQVNYYGDSANDDTVSVSGASTGDNTLSVTPLSASSADVFLGGNPLLTIPPGSTSSNNPGVFGGGAGPDLFVGGVALAGFSVDGGSTGPGNGNRLVVNGKTEDLNGAGGTSAWGGNAFGSPADTVTAGNGYDQIDVSDSKIAINNNAVGALLTVNYATNSFENPSPTQAAVTVNGGDETTPAIGVADDFTVQLSPVIHFQINGGLPATGTAPHGDRLNVSTPNDAEIWSDAATPPDVSIASSGDLPVTYNSIEELNLTPGNGIVNIYGDNNVAGGAQNDGYRVVGTGPNAFTLQISGNKNDPASYSDPIQISGVTTLNAYGEAKGVDNTGSDINALYVTPWANNTPQGWGVQAYWDQGDKNHDGDLLVYNGVSGVSENIQVQPSGSEAGQLFSTNAATGTPVAVINYTLNTNIIVNGNDGSAGDTDTLTLNGTDPANPGSSGNDSFVANFAAAGTPADPMVVVADKVGGAPLYTLQSLSNINTVNVAMQGGSDSFELVSGRTDGSLTVNVDGGAPGGPSGPDSIQVDGMAGSDTFQVSPGVSNSSGSIAAQLAGATAPTALNFTNTETLALSGGGGADDATLYGTGSNNSFALANGTAQVDSHAPISLSGFGAGSTLNLYGRGGTNSFAVDQATGSSFANVNIDGGTAGNGSAAITGTNSNDAFVFTPTSASSGQIAVTTVGTTNYNLTGITSASIDALGGTNSLTTATAGTYVNTPGSQPGSGTVQVTLPGNIATLPLSYANVQNVSFSGTTLVVNGASGNDNVVVAADGSVTVNGNPVSTSGFNALVLNLLGGTDNVSIAASANFPGGITVNGAGQDSVNVTGTAGDDTIGVNAAAGTISGIVAGPITLVGVPNLTVNGGGAVAGDAISVSDLGTPGGLQSINVIGNAAAGDTLQISGSGGPDNMLVTPTGAQSGTLQDSGVGAVVNYSSFANPGALQVTANALSVNGSAANDNFTVTNGQVTVGGDLPVNYNTAASALDILGLGGNDTLTVDSSASAVTTPIYYDGGAGSNSLTLTGGTATSDAYSPGPAAGQGLDALVIGGNTETVHFVNLAPVIDNVAGPLVVNGTNGDDAITAGTNANVVTVNNLESISFANKTSLWLYGQSGNDTFNLTPSNISLGGGSIDVIGSLGANDVVTINGTAGADAINFTPSSANAGTITGLGPTVNISTVEQLVVNGQGGNDSLTINGTSGNDTIVSTLGAANDAGTLAVNSLLALSYQNLGPGGSLAIAGNGGTDTLVANGTAGADAFVVDPTTGTVHVNNDTPINPIGIANLVLNGLGGDNTYDISGPQPYTAITVDGSGNSDPDVLNLNGDGSSPVTVNLGGPTQTVSGGGLGMVDITGVGVVNLGNLGGAIDVLGTTGPDQLSVTPTGASTATIQDNALAPVLNTTNTGILDILEGTAGDGNTLTVHGTSNSETINVVEGPTTTVQVGALKQVSIDTADVEALVVDGGLGADIFNVSGSSGPALSIEGGQTPAAGTLNLATINATVTYGTDPSSGAIDTGAGSNPVINFSGLQTINLTGAGTGSLVVNGTTGDDAITQLGNAVAVNNGAVVAFGGYSSLTLDGVAGNDHFLVNPASLAGVSTFNVYGSSASGDSLVVNGTAVQDAINFAPSAADSGSVTVNAAPAVTFAAIGNVSINGQGGNDLLTVTTPAGPDAITYTPGATIDAASVQVGSLVPMSFSNLGATGRVTLADVSGNPVDSLLYNGTPGNDSFGVNATGIVYLNSQLPVSIPGIASLTLDGQGGVNTFSVDGNSAIPVVVNGGSDSAGNSLTVLGDGTAPLTVDLGHQTVQETGFGAISFNGVSQVNVDAAGQNIDVVGGAGDDNLSVTPTGPQAGNLQEGILDPVVNFTAATALNVDLLGGNNALTVNGSAADDSITATNGQATIAGDIPVNYNVGDLKTLGIDGMGGNDTLTVDSTAGPVLTPIYYDGGAGSNSLTLTGGSASSDIYTPGPAAGQGMDALVIGGSPETVHFVNLAPVIDNVAGPLVVNGTNGDDAINYSADPANPGNGLVSVNNLETISFVNKSSLTINAGAGNDTINLNNPSTPTGLTGITVNGGDPTASNTLIVNGTSGADSIGYNPTGADAGSVTVNALPVVTFTAISSVSINGQGGQDALTYQSPANGIGSELTYTPGANPDSGTVTGDQLGVSTDLTPMTFANLGTFGSVSFTTANAGRTDHLVVNGTSDSDIFNVGNVGLDSIQILKNQPGNIYTTLPMTAPGVKVLGLNGLAGDDTFNLQAPLAFSTVAISGSGTVDPSVTNLTGDGTAVTVNVGGVSTIVSGGGLGTVTITGNEILNLKAAGGAVTTTDSTGPNTLDVTPTDTNAATLQVEGQAPVVNLTNSGAFNVNFTGAGDSLVVNGTTGPDTIDASGSQVTVDSLLAVNYAGATALTVNGGTGSDTFNVTPAAIPIHVNGGDPIGVLPGDTLNILGGGPITFFAGPHNDEGGFQVGSDAAVSFQQIESIGPIVGPGPVLIVGTNGDDDIQVIARDSSYSPLADGNQDYTVSVNAGPNILFINAPQLYIDALSGDDEVDVRAPAPNGVAWNTQVTIAGGAPAGQPGLNGDDFTLETPGSGNQVTYQPTNIDGGVFSLTQSGGNADTSTITLTSAPFFIPLLDYTSSAGGFESATYDGQGGGAGLTVMGGPYNTFTHTAGAASDAGTVAVREDIGANPGSLLALTYQHLGIGLGNTGSVTISGAFGGLNTLVVDGTADNDAFVVDGGTGTIHLNDRVPIMQTGMTNLVLNGYNPNNTFTLNSFLPYRNTAVNSIDPAVLDLVGSAGGDNIGVQLVNNQITGFGGYVTYTGVSQVNLNGNGGADTLTVTESKSDDLVTYKPTGSSGGTFSQAGVPVTFNFDIGTGIFTVNGSTGGGDEVDVLGVNAGSVITVDSPNRTVSVQNSIGAGLTPVVLGPSVQIVGVKGGIGNNTILVIPARNTPPTNDIVGPGFVMPNNLLVNINGGAVSSNAALVVAGANGVTLGSSYFAVVNRTSNTSGVVRMFQSTGGPEPIQYPDISYSNVGIVQASTAVDATTHQQQTLTMGPDLSDPNGSLNNAAYLGSGASINATNLTIFPNAFEHRFLQAEQDWFRVVAQFTGTMDFQVYFKQYAGFLPGGGELQIQVYDAAGNQITSFGVNDTDSDQRRRIPVVAGETYYLQVYGITQDPTFTPPDGFDPTNATVNAYSLSITNTPAPKPDSLGLNDIVAQGSVNNAIAPTTTTFTASDAAVPPPPTQPLPPLSTVDNFYVGKYLEFTSGALIGQRQLVTAYVGATHTFTFASPFSAAPAAGDTFQIESNDTGRSQFDNVTRDNTPTIYIRLDAANTPTDGLIDLQGGGSTSQTPPNNTPILIPFWAGNAATPPNSPANNGSFRVAVYDDTNPQSPIFLGYADAVPKTGVIQQPGVFQLQVATPLSEGSHILAAKVEIDSPSAPSDKDWSSAATFQMVVDTQAPPVYFGSPTVTNSGLLGSSDTGVSGQPATIVDRITADSTPTLYGVAEANAVVRLYDDVNNDGIVDNGDVFLGMATATPVDGTNQFPSGQWQITSNIDLNNPKFGFPLDGVRHLLVTAEDVAGNVSAPQSLTIFLDTQGPNVGGVSVTGSPGYNLFLGKPAEPTPTPLVNSLDVTFNDQPIRVGPDFVYPAVNPALATTVANYQLVGEHTGPIAITSVTFSDSTASGTPGMSVATLHFAAPLPDDRYTLTISDRITDNAGNPLDGEFNGSTFPSGNGATGGFFGGSFTVNSRPHLGDYSAGSVSLDLNGNGSFDPQNSDAANRDAAFTLGFSTDRLFAGKFADVGGTVSGFDKLAAYGFLNGQWRWLLDLDGDGAVDPAKGDLSIVEPLAIDGLPVAGNWTNNPAQGDQIGLFDGKTWWLDVLNHHTIDAADVAAGGMLTGDMRGLPIVGDFDGDGKIDLGTYSNGTFYFDLASRDPGGILTGNYNATINVQGDLPNNIGFAGVLARPVAADMNQDGTTDIGLYVPGRTTDVPSGQAEWFWLVSSAPAGSSPTANFDSLNHPFDPTPLGHDLFYQFGNQFSLPLIGIWDPPTPGGGGGNVGGQSSNGWIQNLYLDVLGRTASSDEIAYWRNAVNQGISPSQIATNFLTSTEHRSQLIDTLYEQYLGRQADQGGIDYWISVWNATGGPEAVQAGIIGSVEYYEKAGGTDTAWVTALYHNILGRDVDAQGLAYWTTFIKTHSKESVVLGFVTSDEYRLGLINGWFQVYLGRKLDTAGGQFWLNAMKNGVTQEQIQAGILGSQEFLNR